MPPLPPHTHAAGSRRAIVSYAVRASQHASCPERRCTPRAPSLPHHEGTKPLATYGSAWTKASISCSRRVHAAQVRPGPGGAAPMHAWMHALCDAALDSPLNLSSYRVQARGQRHRQRHVGWWGAACRMPPPSLHARACGRRVAHLLCGVLEDEQSSLGGLAERAGHGQLAQLRLRPRPATGPKTQMCAFTDCRACHARAGHTDTTTKRYAATKSMLL